MEPLHFPVPPRKILIIKPSAIGDVVHALPVLNLVRRKWHEAHIAWVITPGCAGLIENHPMVDEVIRFDRRLFAAGWRNRGAARGLRHLMRDLNRRQFDLVIDLQGLFRSAWMAWRSGAPVRIGFANAREFAPLFYTHRIESSWENDHAIERYLKMAAALGCGSEPVEFPFAISDEDRRWVDEQIPPGSRYAVMLPGTNWLTKRWPAEKFADLVEPLRRRFGLDTVVAGGPGDAEMAAKIPADYNLVGKTNLRTILALLERADLVIANDSGPMHMAAALGRPLVALYGPTCPIRTGPFRRLDSVVRLDIPCGPCFSRTCSHQSCLQHLGIEPVLRLAERQMNAADKLVALTIAGR